MRGIAKSVVSSWIGHKNTSASASIAFYTIFSIAPLLATGVGAAGLFISRTEAQQEIVAQVARLASPEAAAIVKTVFLHFEFKSHGSFVSSLLIIVMIYSASMVFEELRDSLNKIFGVKPQNTREQLLIFIKGRLIAAIFAFSAGFLVAANMLVSASINIFSGFVGYFPAIKLNLPFFWIELANQIIGLIIVFGIFYSFFRLLPQKKPPSRHLWPGVAISVFLFEAGKYLLRLYLTRTMLASSFGAGGTLVAAILWVYYSVQILLLGAEISNYLHVREMRKFTKSERRQKMKFPQIR